MELAALLWMVFLRWWMLYWFYLHLRDNRNIQQSGVLFVQLHEAQADMLAGRYVCLWLWGFRCGTIIDHKESNLLLVLGHFVRESLRIRRDFWLSLSCLTFLGTFCIIIWVLDQCYLIAFKHYKPSIQMIYISKQKGLSERFQLQCTALFFCMCVYRCGCNVLCIHIAAIYRALFWYVWHHY